MLYIDNHPQSRNYIFTPEPQVPGSPVAYVPCLHICWYWSFGPCAVNPRYQDLWLFANGEAVWDSILLRRRTIINTGRYFLHCQY